ncbi:type II secretion system protein E [Escherichia coli]|uniref:Type II secretion system protein E n=1 Tax=Escherichia coli TaxID=562 RepID=A0A376ZND9_ECOLX|nr:type II secretion system protein E [Escherichia coli]
MRCCWAAGRLTCVSPPCLLPGASAWCCDCWTKNQARLTLERLGLSQQLTAQLRQLLHKPHGIFLVTGPTGSGKSTTLYAGLQELNNHSRNILTVEDPIEYMIEGIGQTQVNTRVGMTFARGLARDFASGPGCGDGR